MQFDHSPNAVPLQASNKTKSCSKPFATGSKTGRSQLGGDFQPSDYSVICGRGKESFNHVGNCRFRSLTSSNLKSYSWAVSKTSRAVIVSDIVGRIRQAGGNFCKYENGAWFEVGDRCAREKVSNVLRGLPHTHAQYRSSVKAKLARRRARTLNKKQNQQYDQELVQGTGHSDDSSTVSSSSSCWGRNLDCLGGQYLPDDVFFDIEYVF
jgi:hypothetical protein